MSKIQNIERLEWSITISKEQRSVFLWERVKKKAIFLKAI